MTSSELLSSLEVALGGICSAPKVAPGTKLLAIDVKPDVFEKLLRHWEAMPSGARPRLRGITWSRDVAPAHLFLLELGGRSPFLLVTVDHQWKARSVTTTWPYAGWWEEELNFERTAPDLRANESGVAWQRG